MNLLSLARTSAGTPEAVPGTNLDVLALESATSLTLERSVWLVCLQGEVIIDLPHGDFRVLKVGDSVHLQPGVPLTLNPLDEAVLLQRTS